MSPSSFTHTFVTHHLSHFNFIKSFVTHQLCYTSSFTHTHTFVTHQLCHTSLSYIIFHTHTHLCHASTLSPTLSHILFHTQDNNFVTHPLSHTTLSHIISHTQLSHTPSFTHTSFTQQLCHTSSFTQQLCHKSSFTHSFVAGMALGHIQRHFVTHPLSHTTNGTWRHLPSFCVAGVVQVALGGALGRRWSPMVTGDAAALCVAGVALGDIYLCVAGVLQVALGGALGRRWSRLVAGDAAALCVAGVALGDIYLRFMWQACHLATSTCVARGRHGTWRHLPSFCVAGVAQVALGGALGRRWSPLTPQHFVRRQHLSSFVGLRFAWQACYRLHLVARLVAVGRRWSPLVAGDAAAL